MGDEEPGERQVSVLDFALSANQARLTEGDQPPQELATELLEVVNALMAIIEQIRVPGGTFH